MSTTSATSAAAKSPAATVVPLQSRLLSAIPGIRHGITNRVADLGKADGNVGYSAPRDKQDAWLMRQIWCDSIGVEASNLVCVYQVHGNSVFRVSPADAGRGADPDSTLPQQADAIVTNEPGVVMMTLHADCMPVMLCDPRQMVVGTVHAGWKSTVLDIAGETIRAMTVEFGTDPGDVIAFLGPAIGVECYEVGADVSTAWIERIGPDRAEAALLPSGDKWFFDLDAANRTLLFEAGVLPNHIESSGICTRCNPDQWFSHRGQGPDTGRYGAIIALADSA